MKTQTLLAVAVVAAMTQFGCKDESSSGSSCAAFSACGGELTGTWTLDDVCIEGDVGEVLKTELALPDECDSFAKSVKVSVAGTLEFTNGEQTTNLTRTTTAQATQACLSAKAGTTVPMMQAICDTLEAEMTTKLGDTVTCSLGSNACDCTATLFIELLDPYTVSGGTVTYTDDATTRDFCVSGTSLTSRDVSWYKDLPALFTAHR